MTAFGREGVETMNNVVFVLDTEKRPLTPCRPAQARWLLR